MAGRMGGLPLVILVVVACSGSPSVSAPVLTDAPKASPTPSPSPTAVPAETAQPTPKPTLTLPDFIDLGTTTATRTEARPSPDFIILAGGYAFATGVGSGIGRFDGTTGALIDSFMIPGGTCEAMDAGFDAAWTATCGRPGLVRIDAATGTLTAVEIGGQMPEAEASIGVGEGAVWMVVKGLPRELVRVDPATNLVTGRFPIPGAPTAVRAGLGGVWVSDPQEHVIHHVDPVSGAIVASIEVGGQPQFLAVGEGAVWTMNQSAGTISRIDPATDAVVAEIELGETVRGGDIAVGGGFLWLRGSRTLLFQIDPATNEIVHRYGPSAGSGSVAADSTAVWITAHDILAIWRLGLDGIVE